MTEFKSAWDITQDLHNLLYDTEKSDNEIYNQVFESISHYQSFLYHIVNYVTLE